MASDFLSTMLAMSQPERPPYGPTDYVENTTPGMEPYSAAAAYMLPLMMGEQMAGGMLGGTRLTLPPGLEITRGGVPFMKYLEGVQPSRIRGGPGSTSDIGWNAVAMDWLNQLPKGNPGFEAVSQPKPYLGPTAEDLVGIVRPKNWAEAVMGTTIGWPEPSMGQVEYMAVNPELQSLARGKVFMELLTEMLRELSSRGVREIDTGTTSRFTDTFLAHLLGMK